MGLDIYLHLLSSFHSILGSLFCLPHLQVYLSVCENTSTCATVYTAEYMGNLVLSYLIWGLGMELMSFRLGSKHSYP